MKTILKPLFLLFISTLIVSCSDDEQPTPSFEENIHSERFKDMELGNSNFILPQSNIDVHTEFEYEGTSKVTKIYFNVQPSNVPSVGSGEVAWELKDHLVPTANYAGQLNPHIHYHVYFDETNKYQPKFKPAAGVYKFKITVMHEDGTKAVITKDLNIVKKFKELEVGKDQKVTFGSDELHIEFEYLSDPATVSDITLQLYFKEWRTGQSVAVGEWNSMTKVIPKNLYDGVKNPHIHYHMDLLKDSPKGNYWLNILVKETGSNSPVKLSVPFVIE